MSDGSPTSPQDVALTTDAANSFRVDVIGGRNEDSTDPTASLDSGTLRHNDVVPQNQFRVAIWGYTNFQATAGADTHRWTYDIDNSGDLLAYEVHEAAAAPGGTRSDRLLSGTGQSTRD